MSQKPPGRNSTAFAISESHPGLTKRELVAAMALQGILSNPDVKPKYQTPIVDTGRIESVNQDYARIATGLADALLTELAK